MDTCIIIPARYNSSRFAGKALAKLDDRFMIRRVIDKCKETSFPVFVATDDKRIANVVGNHVGVIFDRKIYNNGTERVAGALRDYFDDYHPKRVINVQCDMPDVTADMIYKCRDILDNYTVSTVYTDMPSKQQQDSNSVKMIRSKEHALWFCRGISGYGDWHLGVYGYRTKELVKYNDLEVPAEENIEKLEQLRWLKNDRLIGVKHVEFNGIEINTPEDLERWHNG